VRHPLSLAVMGLATLTVATLLAALLLDARRREPQRLVWGLLRTLRDSRRQYAGYVVHLGFMSLAIGVTGSAVGTQRHEVLMNEGETLLWADRQIRYEQLVQQELPDKLIAEAVLHVSHGDAPAVTLRPGRHLHLLQNEWTTEVAIHSTWSGDFYTILHAGLGDGQVSLTFVDNPMMRWIWFGGYVSLFGAVVAIWPTRASRRVQAKQDTDATQGVSVSAIDWHQRRAA
jgi:cytochrome c-type biogenesis protein CcmF